MPQYSPFRRPLDCARYYSRGFPESLKQARTVMVDDLIMINPILPGHPVRNALFRLEGVTAPAGGVGLEIKLTFINRKLARQSLERLLAWDFDKLIIAHGACIEHDAKRYVQQAFRWLAG